MVVAMIAVSMMQAAIDQVIHMIAVRHFWMSAVVMAAVTGDGMATVGIGRRHGDHMFVIVSFMCMMKMTLVEIVDMSVMLNTKVSTMLAVYVCMVGMHLVTHFENSLLV